MPSPEYVSQSPLVPEPRPRRNRTFIITAAVGAVVALAIAAAITASLMHHGQADANRVAATAPAASPPAAAVPAPVTTTAAAETSTLDADSVTACHMISDAPSDPSRWPPSAADVATIQKLTANSSDFDVHFQGQMLSDRYDLYAHSKGTSMELSSTLNLMTAGIQLETACTKAGIR